MGKEKVELTGKDVHVKGTSQHAGVRAQGKPKSGMEQAAEKKQKRESGEKH